MALEMEYMRSIALIDSYSKRNQMPEIPESKSKVKGYDRAFLENSTNEQDEIDTWIDKHQ